jgi:hypothetical protein
MIYGYNTNTVPQNTANLKSAHPAIQPHKNEFNQKVSAIENEMIIPFRHNALL